MSNLVRLKESVNIAIKILKIDEGFSSIPYKDHLGFPTIGHGIRIGPQGSDLNFYELKLPEVVSLRWLENIVTGHAAKLNNSTPWINKLNEVRYAVLCCMAYQMGYQGLEKFRNTLSYIYNSNYEKASEEMLDSLWARKQTPKRAERMAEIMRTGTLINYYQ